MHYEIVVTSKTVSVKFEGMVRALDLILMYQDKNYRQALISKKNLFLDFSQISGSQLTSDDIKGLALLYKLEAEKVSNIKMIILVNKGLSKNIQTVYESIFSDSTWQVFVVESHDDALKFL